MVGRKVLFFTRDECFSYRYACLFFNGASFTSLRTRAFSSGASDILCGRAQSGMFYQERVPFFKVRVSFFCGASVIFLRASDFFSGGSDILYGTAQSDIFCQEQVLFFKVRASFFCGASVIS